MLEAIWKSKKEELAEVKAQVPYGELLLRCPEQPPPSLKGALLRPPEAGRLNIIAEVKYRSPSEGRFPCELKPTELAACYQEQGAAAISVITEKKHFSGDLEYLKDIHESLPASVLLRKDFILDTYQVLEAFANGASAYLLIAASLDRHNLAGLISAGQEFQVEPLVEVHSPWELEIALEAGATLIGVNNRDLKTFEVNIQTSFDLARMLEGESRLTLVSESGLSQRSQLLELRDAGFSGFLIGSSLVKSSDPGRRLAELVGMVEGTSED